MPQCPSVGSPWKENRPALKSKKCPEMEALKLEGVGGKSGPGKKCRLPRGGHAGILVMCLQA